MERKLLTREEFLAAKSLLKRETVPIDGLGDVLIREPNATEKSQYENSLIKTKTVGGQLQVDTDFDDRDARLVAKCVINEDGTRMFSDEDVIEIGLVSGKIVSMIAKKIEKLGGMTPKAVENAEKNSSTTPSSTSPTPSPSSSAEEQ